LAHLLRNATLIDVEGRHLQSGTSVRIDDGYITDVDVDEKVVALNSDTELDCQARYLMPGLMDVHVHLRAKQGKGPNSNKSSSDTSSGSMSSGPMSLVSALHSYLYCGVTSVYDAGNDPDVIWAVREAERCNRILSPRIFCAGQFVTCAGGHGSEFAPAVQIDRLPQDLPLLIDLLDKRPDVVKVTYDEHNWGVRPLIPVLTSATLVAIVEAVHDYGLRITAHISNEHRARQAIDCGVDALAHPVIQSPITEEFAAQLAENKIPVVSTLAIGERYYRLADHPGYLDGPLYEACIDPIERERLRNEEHRIQLANRWADWMRVMTPIAQENIRVIVEAGGIVASGTDLSLGPELLHELDLLQEAGVSSWEVLRSATINAAVFLGQDDTMGSIARGKVADLVLLDEDPTTDVSQLTSISGVIKGGQIIKREDLKLEGRI